MLKTGKKKALGRLEKKNHGVITSLSQWNIFLFLMDQHTQIEEIFWFFLKHWHSCPHLKCSLIPSKIKSLLSVWSHWPENMPDLEILIFQHILEGFFFFSLNVFYFCTWANDELLTASTWQLIKAFFALQVCGGIKAACLKSFVVSCRLNWFQALSTLLYENELCDCCNYLSQHGKGK